MPDFYRQIKRLFGTFVMCVFALLFTCNVHAESAGADDEYIENEYQLDLAVSFNILPVDMQNLDAPYHVPRDPNADTSTIYGMIAGGGEGAFEYWTLQDILEYSKEIPKFNPVIRCQFLDDFYMTDPYGVFENGSIAEIYETYDASGAMKWLNAFSVTPDTNQCWFWGNREIDCSTTLREVAIMYQESLNAIDEEYLAQRMFDYIDHPYSVNAQNNRDGYIERTLETDPNSTVEIIRRISCYVVPSDDGCIRNGFPMTVSAPELPWLDADGIENTDAFIGNKILMDDPDDIPLHLLSTDEYDGFLLSILDPYAENTPYIMFNGPDYQGLSTLLPIAYTPKSGTFDNMVRDLYGWGGGIINEEELGRILNNYDNDITDSVDAYISNIRDVMSGHSVYWNEWCPMGITFDTMPNLRYICDAGGFGNNGGICDLDISNFTEDSADYMVLMPIEFGGDGGNTGGGTGGDTGGGSQTITYSVKYNANGGSGTMSNSSHTYGVAKTLSTNTFTRTGYTFNGWNTTADGTGTSYSDGASVTNLTSTNGATINLYAQWTANPITITLNKNGGSGTVGGVSGTANGTITCSYNTNCTLPSWNSSTNNIAKSGYVFIGWATSAGATSAVSNTIKPTAAATYYAVWTKASCSATNASCNNVSVSNNTPSATFYCDPGYAQYSNNTVQTFTATGTAGNPVVSRECAAVPYLDIYYQCVDEEPIEDGRYISFENFAPDYSVCDGKGYDINSWEFYAFDSNNETDHETWSPADYNDHAMVIEILNDILAVGYDTVYIRPRATTTSCNAISVVYYENGVRKQQNAVFYMLSNDGATMFEDPACTMGMGPIPEEYWGYGPGMYLRGFTMTDPDTLSDGEAVELCVGADALTFERECFTPTDTTWYALYDCAYGYSRVDGSGDYGLSDGTTYYSPAYCDAVAYKITYEENGGSAVADKTYTIETPTFTLPTPTREGYTFAGWYTASTGGTKVTQITQGSTGNKTLYARWTASTYTVKYNANGGSGTMADTTCTYGQPCTLSTNTFSRVGYVFDGWTENNESATIAENTITVSSALPDNTITVSADWANCASGYYCPGSNEPIECPAPRNDIGAASYGDLPGHIHSADINGNGVRDLVAECPTAFLFGEEWYVNLTPGLPLDDSYDPQSDANIRGVGIAYCVHGNHDDETLYNGECTGYPVVCAAGYYSTFAQMDGGNTWRETNKRDSLNDFVTQYCQPVGDNYWSPSAEDFMTTGEWADDLPEPAGTTELDKYKVFVDRYECPANSSSAGVVPADRCKCNDGYVVGGIVGGATETRYDDCLPITYTVKYNANGGTGTMADTTCTYGQPCTLSTNTFSRVGYVFDGWTVNNESATIAENTITVSSALPDNTITVSAKWNEFVGYYFSDSMSHDGG
ncbi:MAG: InlB B-repeat-containing protein, partial [Alphaproteobacteria bacterium]